MAEQTPQFAFARSKAWEAFGDGDEHDLFLNLHHMTYSVAPRLFKRRQVKGRVADYDELFKIAPRRISSLLPDIGSIMEDWSDTSEELDPNDLTVPNLQSRILRGSLLLNPIEGFAAEIYNINGVPKQLDLWANKDDFNRAGIVGVEAKWRSALTSMTPEFIPGKHAGMLLTSPVLGGEHFLVCCYDGDNIYGSAARAFLPIKTAHIQHSGQFFYFVNQDLFDGKVKVIAEEVKKHGLQFLALALGFEDLDEVRLMGFTVEEVFAVLRVRLIDLAHQCGCKVFFCGLIPKGNQELQAMVEGVQQRLFQDSLALGWHKVIPFDCCSPSVSVDMARVYEYDGGFTPAFKAVTLYAISRVVAMNFHNILVPRPDYLPTDRDLGR